MHKLDVVASTVLAAVPLPVRVPVAHAAAVTLQLADVRPVDVVWRLPRAAHSTRPKSAR